jgi:anti-sigma B factor antagonist
MPYFGGEAGGIRRFSLGVLRHDDRYTLLFGGELDLASAPSIEDLTRKLCADGASEIVLDLSALAFIDSAGLDAILESRTLCEEHQCGFCLIPGVRNIERLYELDGLIDKLPWAPPGLWSDSAPAYEPREGLRLVSSRS